MASQRPSMQSVSVGLVVAVVGFFSSFPIVLQGLTAMGATNAQAASGLMAAALAMAAAGIGLSLWTRQPISAAWSTPGVALLAIAAVPAGGFHEAVGAFLIAGVLTVIAGFWKPMGRLIAAIPAPLAQAMLAGVLLSLCGQPFVALAERPYLALPIILTWFLVSQISRLFAVPAAVAVAALVVAANVGFDIPRPDSILARPLLFVPEFSLAGTISIALPLFVVTMATQNIPGLAVVRSFGYAPPAGPSISSVGVASVLSAPFGAPATCLAAITASMCANDDSHPDPSQRYWSAVCAGFFYAIFGVFAGVITSFALLAPHLVMGTITGVALLGVFANSTVAALEPVRYRQAAAITFLVTASGISILGLSAAVWGLLIGGLVQLVKEYVDRRD